MKYEYNTFQIYKNEPLWQLLETQQTRGWEYVDRVSVIVKGDTVGWDVLLRRQLSMDEDS